MARPLRSLLIGDVDFYNSEYAFLVAQGMTLLGYHHATVNIRQDWGVIAKRVREMQPDIIWGHMLFWPPPPQTAPAVYHALKQWRWHYGCKIVIHDGDAKPQTRFPYDLSNVVDLALCNHTSPRSEWKIPCLRWPYGAFTQAAIAEPVPEFTCDLLFAGRMDPGGIYAERTAVVNELKNRLGDRMLVLPNERIPHTLFRTPEVAASARAVLGWARPDAPGWTDVRVFQYPGAGGILLHNGAEEWLMPGLSYIPFLEPTADSVLKGLERVLTLPEPESRQLRHDAFEYVQQRHSSVPRVRQVLQAVGLA